MSIRQPQMKRHFTQMGAGRDKGNVFKEWYECRGCRTTVQKEDKYCRNCGMPFSGPIEEVVK